MEGEFESYNKNIDEFDARNIFEFDELKELNRIKIKNTRNDKKNDSEKNILLIKKNDRRFLIN
jgi:hypothetical protein